MRGELLLLVEVKSHDMVLLEILDFPLFVDELTLLILEFLFGDDPVVVDPLALLLEVGQHLLLLLVVLLQLAQFLPHRKLNLGWCTLYSSDSVSFTFWA